VVEAQEPPVETAAEPEPNMTEVFEELRKRDPETQPVNTESPRFKAQVAELKEKANRVGRAAGRLLGMRADIEAARAKVNQDRIDRRNERLKRNRERAKNRPMDDNRKRIIELTKDEKFPQGRNPDFENGLREWLRERGYDDSIKKKGFLDSLVGPVVPLRKDKRDRMDALRATLTPEVRAVLEEIYRKPEKGK
jgi:hypothetical protein